MVQSGINKTDVLKLWDKLYEGMYVTTPIGKAKLLKKYPNFAVTDKGNWKWIEVYLAEHGGMCEDRKKLIKEKIEEVKAYYGAD